MSSHWIGTKTRELINARDNNTCVYCHSTENLSLDHVIPRTQGGSLKSPKNLITACCHCNSARGRMTIPEFTKYLRTAYGIDRRGLEGKIAMLTSIPVILRGKEVE